MNKRIQILRGLAIIAVVIIHTNTDGLAGVITRPFVNFAVATFFFLSGYLTNLKISDIKSFYKKRLVRVAVPYTVWSIIYTIAFSSYNDFFAKFLTGRCCGPYYFIFVYSFFVLLTPLISKMIQSKLSWVGWMITPISLLLTRYVVAFMGKSLPSGSLSFLFTNWFIFYYFGMCIGNKKIKYNFSNIKALIILAVSLAFSIVEGVLWFNYGNYDMATTQLRFTSILTSLGSILLMCKYLESSVIPTRSTKIKAFFNRLFICIGDCSFGIYLSHILIMGVLGKVPIVRMLPFPLFSIAVIIVSTSCVLIGNRILGKKFSWVLGL